MYTPVLLPALLGQLSTLRPFPAVAARLQPAVAVTNDLAIETNRNKPPYNEFATSGSQCLNWLSQSRGPPQDISMALAAKLGSPHCSTKTANQKHAPKQVPTAVAELQYWTQVYADRFSVQSNGTVTCVSEM